MVGLDDNQLEITTSIFCKNIVKYLPYSNFKAYGTNDL